MRFCQISGNRQINDRQYFRIYGITLKCVCLKGFLLHLHTYIPMYSFLFSFELSLNEMAIPCSISSLSNTVWFAHEKGTPWISCIYAASWTEPMLDREIGRRLVWSSKNLKNAWKEKKTAKLNIQS